MALQGEAKKLYHREYMPPPTGRAAHARGCLADGHGAVVLRRADSDQLGQRLPPLRILL